MWNNYGLDEKCRVYISLKDIIYDRELTDFGVIVNAIVNKDTPLAKKRIAQKAFYSMPGMREFIENTNLETFVSPREQIIKHVIDNGIMKRVYYQDNFNEETMKGLDITPTDVILLAMSNTFFNKTSKVSSSIYFLFDDNDKKYIPDGLEYFKDRLINVNEFFDNYDTYTKDDGETIHDIIIGLTYLRKYYNKIKLDKKVKLIVPEVDAMIFKNDNMSFMPTLIYKNAIIN